MAASLALCRPIWIASSNKSQGDEAAPAFNNGNPYFVRAAVGQSETLLHPQVSIRVAWLGNHAYQIDILDKVHDRLSENAFSGKFKERTRRSVQHQNAEVLVDDDYGIIDVFDDFAENCALSGNGMIEIGVVDGNRRVSAESGQRARVVAVKCRVLYLVRHTQHTDWPVLED